MLIQENKGMKKNLPIQQYKQIFYYYYKFISKLINPPILPIIAPIISYTISPHDHAFPCALESPYSFPIPKHKPEINPDNIAGNGVFTIVDIIKLMIKAQEAQNIVCNA